MGEVMPQFLDTMKIPHRTLDGKDGDRRSEVGGGNVYEEADSCRADYHKRCCERVASMRPEQGTMQSRAMAMAALLELLTDQPVIICNGFPSREAQKIADRPTHFYMIGSMGMAAAIALGVALAKPKKQVVIFDGDGNVLMGMGTLGHSRRAEAEELHSCGV